MSNGTVGFIGDRLLQAREARGLTAVYLSDLIGVTPQTISQYEHGHQTPRPEIMERIANQLNLKRSFFIKDIQHKAGERIFYRSMSTVTKLARTRAERRLEWVEEIVFYLEQFFDFPIINLPQLDIPTDFREIKYEQIENFAEECRQYWNLATAPVPNLVNLLENSGVIVTRSYLQAETLDAFSEFDENKRPYIFLGADKNVGVRSRFDAAHELGHIILHNRVKPQNINSKVDFKLIENQAHYFASAFLLPQEEFTKGLWGATLDALWSLKDKWRVSIAAMIKRCESIGIISNKEAKRMWINLGRRGWRKLEPLDETIKIEKPELLKFCFEQLVNSGVKGKNQIVDELCLSGSDIESLAGLPIGYLNEGPDFSLPKLKIKEGSNIIPFRPKL